MNRDPNLLTPESFMSVIGKGHTAGTLTDGDVRQIVARAADEMQPDGRRILAIIPDHTRTCPLPLLARELHAALAGRARQLDFLVALGTHPPLSDEQLDRLLGVEPGGRDEALPGSRVFNHRWKDPQALTALGVIPAARIDEITQGRFAMDVEVTINRLIRDYDLLLVVGPVFPHEVVGFSGGDKYFFPGICGAALLNFFHWLGAVITCPKIIGTARTPVRDTLEAAADMIPTERRALTLVVTGEDLAGMYFGDVREAWAAAAELSRRLHITYCDHPYQSVLAQAPRMYDDIWTAGKCMYKMEPVVADGGELIIYAPHVKEFSVTHGHIIEQIGYHIRDYFLADWDRFKATPWGVLAHSTHVRGIGTMEGGVERPRITVTLATGIPEQTCRKAALGYRDPASIDPADWQGRDDRLYVPKAGEMLHKLKNPPAWQRFDGDQGG